jgi:cell filamentation protein
MKKDGQTDYTPPIEDNLLGITDKDLVNLYEANGIAKAEVFIQNLDEDVNFDTTLILDIHRIAFGELYDWAGKWRNIEVQVGKLTPPTAMKIPFLMYQYADDVNYRMKITKNEVEIAELLAHLHHRFVWIHPFNNGNGRTARLLLNLAAMINGYEPIRLYHREGDARVQYIEALRAADVGDMSLLSQLILSELTPL